MTPAKKIESELVAWPNMSVHPHRFGGREFRFGRAEVGHVHANGVVDIPFTRPMRDALLSADLAEEHHHVPDSGWVTFVARTAKDVDHAMWLMRISYLRYALKAAPDAGTLFEHEAEALHLNAEFKSLLERFVSKTTATQPV